MAVVGTLAYKIVADSSQFSRGVTLTRTELRNLRTVMRESESEFAAHSRAVESLDALLAKGAITVEQHRHSMQQLTDELQKQSPLYQEQQAAMARGEQVTRSVQTEQEKFAERLRELDDLLDRSAITQETYNRAVAKAKPIDQAAAAAAAERAQVMERGKQIARQVETQTERLAREQQELDQLYRRGAILTEEYTRASSRLAQEQHELSDEFKRSEREAEALHADLKRGEDITRGVENATEKYNRELAELTRLHRSGHISTETFNRRQSELSAEINRANPLWSRMTGAVANIHPALIAAGVATAGLGMAWQVAHRIGERFVDLVREQFDEIDKLAKSASKLGIATNELVDVRKAAAEFGGVANGVVDQALTQMSRRISEATQGTGEAGKALKSLNLDAKALNNLGTAEAFRAIASAMENVENPADRVRIAMQLFGRQGAELVTTLTAGSAALDEISERNERLRMSLNSIDAAKVETANDRMGDLKDAVTGLAQEVAVAAAPSIAAMADRLTTAIQRGSELGGTIDQALTIIGPGFDLASRSVDGFVQRLETANMLAGRLAPLLGGENFTTGAIKGLTDFIFGAAQATHSWIDALNDANIAVGVLSGAAQATDEDFAAQIEKQEQLEKSAESLTQQLIEQAANFGLTARQAQINSLAMAGATDEQLRLAEAADKVLTELEAQAEAEAKRQEVLNRGLQLTDSLKTAEERRAEQIADAKSLLDVGAISQETYNRAIAKYEDELRKATDTGKKSTEQTKQQSDELKRLQDLANRPLGPAVALRDSKEEFEALLRLRRFKEAEAEKDRLAKSQPPPQLGGGNQRGGVGGEGLPRFGDDGAEAFRLPPGPRGSGFNVSPDTRSGLENQAIEPFRLPPGPRGSGFNVSPEEQQARDDLARKPIEPFRLPPGPRGSGFNVSPPADVPEIAHRNRVEHLLDQLVKNTGIKPTNVNVSVLEEF